jgi:N-acetylglutamate synthase-like GNAT family acetyltransferase
MAELSPDQVADAVSRERTLALAGGYALEWKVYGHDDVPQLADALLAAGYAANDKETVLGIALENTAWRRFIRPSADVRVVRDQAGLADVARISRAIGRLRVDEETRELGAALRERPDVLSMYVAYANGKPVSCGRLHHGQDPAVAELAGGRTVPEERNKGYFTAVVAARLNEAAERGRRYVFVDALPTSEPILRNLGFTTVTTTQPFTVPG